MTTTAKTATAPATTRCQAKGDAVELVRYTVPSGERILAGRRVNGEAILLDMPSGDEGRVYLVERCLDDDGNGALQALIRQYLADADEHQAIPMARARL